MKKRTRMTPRWAPRWWSGKEEEGELEDVKRVRGSGV